MTQRLLRFFICICLISTQAFAQETYLVVNPQGHKGQVRSMIVSPDGKYFYTASFDKTIKRWRLADGQLIRTYYGEIGPGAHGQYYCMAISPDGQRIAAGGWMGSEDMTQNLGVVRVFDVTTGLMTHCLEVSFNVINDLIFIDNETLVAGSGDGELRALSLPNNSVSLEYEHSENSIRGLAHSDKYLVVGDYLGNISMYKEGKAKALATGSVPGERPIEQLYIDEDREVIFCSAGEFLYELDFKLKVQHSHEMHLGWFRFDFSPQNQQIAFTTYPGPYKVENDFEEGEHQAHIFQWKPGQLSPFKKSGKHSTFIGNIELTERDQLLVNSYDHNEIISWNLSSNSATPSYRINNNGLDFQSAFFDGKHITYTTEENREWELAKQLESPPTDAFTVANQQFGPYQSNMIANMPVTQSGSTNLKLVNTGEGVLERKVLEISKNGQRVNSIEYSPIDGYEISSFGFTQDQIIIAGGAQGILRGFNVNGGNVGELLGHEGVITGVSLSSDDKYLVTCAGDQTIRLWLLDELREIERSSTIPSMWESIPGAREQLEELKLKGASQKRNVTGWEYCIKELKRKGYEVDWMVTLLEEMMLFNVQPYLNFFFTLENEWIIWDREGYFMSSKNGAQFVRYHVNQEQCKEAKSYPFEQFDLKFNRPDIILKDLSYFDEQLIELYRLAYEKRLKKLNIEPKVLSEEIHAPEVNIDHFKHDPNKGILELEITASDDKYDLAQLNVYVNDVAVYGRQGKVVNGQSRTEKIKVHLVSGENKVQVSALNMKGAESLKETIDVIQKELAKPDLYLVGIGANEFTQSSYNLKYPAKDVNDLIAHFQSENAGEVYGNIHVKSLTGKEVTKANILSLSGYIAQAKPNDVVVLFVAGHGVLDQNYNYYFATYDIDFKHPEINGLAYEQLESLLDGIPALKKLIFMDTCHSGEIEKDEVETVQKKTVSGDLAFRAVGDQTVQVKAGLGNTTALMKEMFVDLRRGTGATVISSAGGVEFALEGDKWANGLFTYALLEGLESGKADSDGDGQIRISELKAYVSQQVKELSNGQQQPTSRMENISNDFRVY